MQSDEHLWQNYFEAREAGDQFFITKFRRDIVAHHLGFIRDYARQTAFNSWNQDQKDEYLAELVLVAMRKVDTFDPEHSVKFITYIKHSFRPERSKHQARQQTVWKGTESTRIESLISHLRNKALAGDYEISAEELAEEISKVHGKKVGIARVLGILDQPQITSGDTPIAEGGNSDHEHTVFDTVTDGVDIADTFTDREESKSMRALVRDALVSMELTPAEHVIVERVFEAPPRRSFRGQLMEPGPLTDTQLAAVLDCKPSQAKAMREALAERLRSSELLCSLRP